MILADKIINERKKCGWSQEELAEQLGVSRQSVSKWESAQSVPDLNRILQMAELFGVSTDYLLKDELEPEMRPMVISEGTDIISSGRHVSMEEATAYISNVAKTTPTTALGVSLCITSPVVLIFLVGLWDNAAAAIIGVAVLLLMIAIAVFIFIMNGKDDEKYEYFNYEKIDTAYGVDGMVRERKEKSATKNTMLIGLGVVLCILSSVPLITVALMEFEDYVVTSMVCVLLILVAIAVNLFVRVGSVNECYNKLLEEGDYTPGKKASIKTIERVGRVYWSIALAIYLACSFITNRWEFTWIVWPVAAVAFPIVTTITKFIIKAEE